LPAVALVSDLATMELKMSAMKVVSLVVFITVCQQFSGSEGSLLKINENIAYFT
jgi:hypothetical protein